MVERELRARWVRRWRSPDACGLRPEGFLPTRSELAFHQGL